MVLAKLPPTPPGTPRNLPAVPPPPPAGDSGHGEALRDINTRLGDQCAGRGAWEAALLHYEVVFKESARRPRPQRAPGGSML